MDIEEERIHPPFDRSKAQIRLLHLQPRLESEPDNITRAFEVPDLDSDCKYEAFSYEWGDPRNTSLSIVLEGRKFPVRENPLWALWHRRQETVRVIWIDALRIDQNSVQERFLKFQESTHKRLMLLLGLDASTSGPPHIGNGAMHSKLQNLSTFGEMGRRKAE